MKNITAKRWSGFLAVGHPTFVICGFPFYFQTILLRLKFLRRQLLGISGPFGSTDRHPAYSSRVQFVLAEPPSENSLTAIESWLDAADRALFVPVIVPVFLFFLHLR